MTEKDPSLLPVLGQPDEAIDTAPSCSPAGYVSNEELALLKAMTDLRQRALDIRSRLETVEPAERPSLEDELEDLRHQRRELTRRRDQAFIRKMVMLGHLPPSALDEPRDS